MAAMYTFGTEEEAKASMDRFILRGTTVFLPYYEPTTKTWNIIIR